MFEVDSRAVLERKKDLLAAQSSHHRRPTFVTVDWFNIKSLLPNLVAAGFDPARRCVVLATGLLYYLSPAAVGELVSDISALSSPGSRIFWDFIHSDVLEAKAAGAATTADGAGTPPPAVLPAGFATLAAAVANKGCAFQSGFKPSISGDGDR